jgi:cytoskeletal protein RodZ
MFQQLRKLAVLGVTFAGFCVAVPSACAIPETQDQSQTDARQKKDTDKSAKQQDKTAKQDDSKKDTAKDSASDKKNSTTATSDSLSHRGLKGKKPGPPAGTPGEAPGADDKKPQ